MNSWWIVQAISEASRRELLDEAERQRFARTSRKPSFRMRRPLAAALAAIGLTVTMAAVWSMT